MTKDPFAEELIATLVDELHDQTKVMKAELDRLRTAPERPEPVDVLLRVAHTLKGATRAADVRSLEAICQVMEEQLIATKASGKPIEGGELDRLDGLLGALVDTAIRLGSRAKLKDPFGSGRGPSGPERDPLSVRVLAVEDSPTQATKLRGALGGGGYAIVEARTGEAALTAFAAEHVDAVVSDVMMPGSVDGYELCRRIKRERPDVLFILLTSLSDPLDIIRGLEVGADSFLTKPYLPEHLLARLDLLLANRRERARNPTRAGVSVRFMDREFVIESGREQILDLLVTTFEDAVRQNRELIERKEQLSTRTAELERALRALEEAQEELARKERLAVLGKLSGSVGHELRNPLGVMTNAVYFLKLVLQDPPEKVTEYLGILKHQIQLSEKIVADLLDFARIKPPQRTATEVRKLIDDQIARTNVPEGVTIEARFPPTVPKVDIDPVQVGQVVLNLITNGVQAMEGTSGVLTIDAEMEGGLVKLSFEDTGPGVAEENRAKIFEPLFTTKARGIGLGLAVSRSLAEANGGSLALGTSRGTGARFDLHLPAAPSPA